MWVLIHSESRVMTSVTKIVAEAVEQVLCNFLAKYNYNNIIAYTETTAQPVCRRPGLDEILKHLQPEESLHELVLHHVSVA